MHGVVKVTYRSRIHRIHGVYRIFGFTGFTGFIGFTGFTVWDIPEEIGAFIEEVRL